MPRIKFTQDELNRMKELYKSGLSTYDIADVFGVSHQTINRRLRKMDIEIRPRSMPANVNELFFNDLGSERSAYWLGLLFADGNIYNHPHGQKMLSLAQSTRDIKQMEQFVLDMEYDGNIYNYVTKDGCTMVMVQIRSNYLCNHLIDLGCTPRKSLTLQFPTEIPEYSMRHFLRGFCDGDGCLGIYDGQSQIQICLSSYLFLVGYKRALRNLLPHIGDVKIVKVKNRNYYHLAWGGRFQCADIARFLYGDCSVALQRKLEIAQQMMAMA